MYSKIENDEFYIGNRQLMVDNKIEISNDNDENELVEKGNSVLYVSKNNQIIALVGVKDIIRDNAKAVVSKLKEKNINVVMLTGDNPKTAKVVADEIGIENIIANVKPKEKAEKINELKKDGIVAMCGDGINDSVSLVAADIGISISNGTDIAINSAQIVLMNNNLEKINLLCFI